MTTAKRVIMCAVSLLLFLFSNVRILYRADIDGDPAPGLYSKKQLSGAYAAAQAVLWEISAGEGSCPQPKLTPELAFKTSGTADQVTDLILMHTYGVEKLCAVYADGVYLGVSADENELRERLESFVYDQMPLCAERGEYSRPYTLETVYTARGRITPTDDMVLLISGKAPVMYYTADGKRA